MPRKTKVAGWGRRFWAWLVDVVIIGWFTQFIPVSADQQLLGGQVLLFLYWTIFEGGQGQALGAMAMKLKLVRDDGKKIKTQDAVVSAFGKAFLLPFDVAIGYLSDKESKLRIFQRIAKVRVVSSA